MTKVLSRQIESNQTGPHERLEQTVKKHLSEPFLKPFADHTKQAFDVVNERVQVFAGPIILDSCCGVGDSSRKLAQKYTDHLVIGVDKSAKRLSTEREQGTPSNLVLVRADLNDFFRLVAEAGWPVDQHYLLYPNPWPKSAHLGRRWHGAPVFPSILKIGKTLEMRSNWQLYLKEFSLALSIAGVESELTSFQPQEYLTPFEQKYHGSGQQLWRLTAQVSL